MGGKIMKVKVLFIAPYEAMVNLVEECSEKERELDIQIKIGNLQEGVELAKLAESQGVEVIISRGGTAKLIAESVDIPVINLQISGYDMLRVLTLANDFPRKKAIVGFSSITNGAKAIIDLLEIPIDIFTIDNEEETEPLLKKLKQDGYQLIMGDVVTFDTASRLGLLGILIQSGREAIFDAFKEAKTFSRWLSKTKLQSGLLKSILENKESDFMLISENGATVYEQWSHFQSRPVTDISLDTSSNQKEVMDVIDYDGEPLKVTKSSFVFNDLRYFLFEFSRLKITPSLNRNLKVCSLSPPIIISQSESMETCLNMIHRSLANNHFILTGQRGTEQELIAQYIHYHKFQGEGLFASIKANEFLHLSVDILDKDIRTFYIHTFTHLNHELRNELWNKAENLRTIGMTIILSIIEDEQPLWENMIYQDEIIRLYIPSLAERKKDFQELVTSFILHFHQTLGTSAIRINEKGIDLLVNYPWPGNVEELKAFIKDAVLMEMGYVINPKLIELLLNKKGNHSKAISSELLTGTLEDIEKKIIERVLEEENYNQTKAAKRLNINRSTLWRKLKS